MPSCAAITGARTFFIFYCNSRHELDELAQAIAYDDSSSSSEDDDKDMAELI